MLAVSDPSNPLSGGRGLREIAQAPGICKVFLWQNVATTLWFGKATADAVSLLYRVTADLRQALPEGMSSVYILRAGLGLPEPAAREGLIRMSNDFADWLAGVAVVVAGSGFWASTFRSVVTAMRLLGPRTYEMRIHSTFEEVVEWLPAVHLKRTGVAIDAAELLAVLREIDASVPES